MTLPEDKKIVIIDCNSVVHRAYHALPRLTTKSGILVNAVYGFLLVLLRAINDFKPEFIIAAFDFPRPTFRHKIYKDYKAQRPKAPEDLYSQIPLIKDVLGKFGIIFFEKEGFEADDIIGTVVSKIRRSHPGFAVIILSGDSDSFQLIDSNTKVFILKKGVKDTVLLDKTAVINKFGGLTPSQLLSFKALRGDPSDNIPGVKGIGDKTAIKLILNFGSLENLYNEIKKGTKKAVGLKNGLKQALVKFENSAVLSKKLVRLEKNVPINFDLNKCAFGNYPKKEIINMLNKLEFYSLAKRLENGCLEKNKTKTTGDEQGKLL